MSCKILRIYPPLVFTLLITHRNEDRILALPFTLSLLLICGHCIQIAWKASLTGQPVNADGAHDIAHPDCRRIFWYMLARLFGCLTLLGLSVYALSESVFRGEQMSCPEIYMFFAFVSPFLPRTEAYYNL